MNLYWIGARQWDIHNNNLFKGSVTRFGIDNSLHYSFCNNNYTKNYRDFLNTQIHHILSIDKNAFFMFANEKDAYKFGEDVFNKSICVNPLHILESMNDKIFTRNFFSDCVNTPNSIVLNSSSCTNYKFVKELFNKKYSAFVLQGTQGAGGLSNYLLSYNCTPQIPTNIPYVLITPYFGKNITVNVHIITNGESYKILPPSIQITLNNFKYSGSDFIAFTNMPSKIKNRIFSCATKIAQKVNSIGAKGIFGVDLLILENDILFLECNYRYQGSSFVLNKGLTDAGYPSIFELRYDSFYKDLTNIPDDIFNTPIPFSSFRRTKWNENITLPHPTEILAINNSEFASVDNYIRYELFKSSITQSIEKQEEQNPY